MRIIYQGDQYAIPVLLKTMNGAVIDNTNASAVRIKIGGKSAYWPDGNLVYEDEAWQFPLTQAASYKMLGQSVEFQAQVQYESGTIFSSKTQTITVGQSIFKDEWNSNASESTSGAPTPTPSLTAVVPNAQIAPINATILSPTAGGASDYEKLNNLPQINDVTISGNKNGAHYGLVDAPDTAAVGELLQVENVDASGAPTAWNTVEIADSATQGSAQPISSGAVYTELENLSYNDLENQPQINGNTLDGNQTGAALGLVDAVAGKGLSTNDYTDADKAQLGTNTSAIATNASNIANNSDAIAQIEDVIPPQASSNNQLADKQFVNSSIQTSTAHYRGSWATWAAVPTDASLYPQDDDGVTTPTSNDYLVVQDAADYPVETGEDALVGTWRFKYSGLWATNGKSGWHPEYQVNEEPLTAAQIAALNSGITAAGVAQIGANQTAISGIKDGASINSFAGVETALGGKQNTLTFDQTPTAGSSNPVTSGGVATALDSKAATASVPASLAISAAGTMTFRNTSGTALFTGQLPLYDGGVV